MQTKDTKKAEPGRYLGFCLGTELYAVPIRAVAEIIGFTGITPVPSTPSFIRGVLNLRGKVIPVVDLRVKLHLPEVPSTRETCIIVMEAWSRQIGVVVDSVREVLDFTAVQIEDTPELGSKVQTKYIFGLGKTANEVVILVDPDAVLSPAEMGLLDEVSKAA